MKIEFNNHSTVFSANLIENTIEDSTPPAEGFRVITWHSLEIGFYQICDTEITTTARFNTVSKEDLLKMSKMFSDLAETIK